MPTQKEHRLKYQENKDILDSLFDVKNKEHCNWITTISFYAALHMIEYQFAAKNVDNKNHNERQENMANNCDLINKKVQSMYKQMGTNSRIARYKSGNISPTIANQMLIYLSKIENEFGFPKVNNENK